MNHSIDINCDLGESYGQFIVGKDEQIFPLITSCNIACGFHGGDPLHITKTIQNALNNNVQIGAHPSYPDLHGFGRRPMNLSKEELTATVKYQIAALKGLTESMGGVISYVKPHGALYNAMANNTSEALTVIQAIKEIDGNLSLMGLAGSALEQLATQNDIHFIREAFADRRYNEQGQLVSRNEPDAVILSTEKAVNQVMGLVLKRQLETIEGGIIPIEADSICIHGDNPNAVNILKAIRQIAKENNIVIKAFHR